MHNLLSSGEKATFKKAITNALRKIQFTSETVAVVETLLTVSRNVGATSVLEILADKLADEWRGHLETSTFAVDAAWTVEVLGGYAGEDSTLTRDTIKSVEALARQRQMPGAFVIPLFELLCETQREHLDECLEIFWPHLNAHLVGDQRHPPSDENSPKIDKLLDFIYEIGGFGGVIATLHKSIQLSSQFHASKWFEKAVYQGEYGDDIALFVSGDKVYVSGGGKRHALDISTVLGLGVSVKVSNRPGSIDYKYHSAAWFPEMVRSFSLSPDQSTNQTRGRKFD